MIIVWGRKLVRTKLGRVADHCPVCHGVRAFTLQRVGSAGHLYYISLGEGELVGHERVCRDCGTAFRAEPGSYAAIVRKKTSLKQLVRDTFPDVAQVHRERLALEEKAHTHPEALTPHERDTLIRTPFVCLMPRVEQRFANTQIDKETGLALLGALLLVAVVPALVKPLWPDQVELGVLAGLVLGIALVAWQVLVSGRRYMRRHIVPLLARSLKPLQPTEGELRSVQADLKKARHKMGQKLWLPDLQAALAAQAR